MTAREILDEIRMLGGRLEARGDRLHVDVPKAYQLRNIAKRWPRSSPSCSHCSNRSAETANLKPAGTAWNRPEFLSRFGKMGVCGFSYRRPIRSAPSRTAARSTRLRTCGIAFA